MLIIFKRLGTEVYDQESTIKTLRPKLYDQAIRSSLYHSHSIKNWLVNDYRTLTKVRCEPEEK